MVRMARNPARLAHLPTARMPERLAARAFARTLLALAVLAGVAGACSGDAERVDEPLPQRTVAEARVDGPVVAPDPVDEATAARAREVGGPAAAFLAEGLVRRLGDALDQGGTAFAVDFCAGEAMALTDELAGEHDGRLALKRATNRPRNPANAPDDFEARVLRYLEALEAAEPGSAPETLVAAGPDDSVRFYRTLRMAPLCLQCHGEEDSLASDVRAMIAERYPEDRATGYTAGEFRGVLRVQIPGELVVSGGR